MAKLNAPLLSLSAQGGFGKSIIYQGRKSQHTAKQFQVPSDPKTPAQLAHRAVFHSASVFWSTLVDLNHNVFTFSGAGVAGVNIDYPYGGMQLDRPYFLTDLYVIVWGGEYWKSYSYTGEAHHFYRNYTDSFYPPETGWICYREGIDPPPTGSFPKTDVKKTWDLLRYSIRSNRSGWQLFSAAALAAGSENPDSSFFTYCSSQSIAALVFNPVRLSDFGIPFEIGTFSGFAGKTVKNLDKHFTSSGPADAPVFDLSGAFDIGDTIYFKIEKTISTGKSIPRSGVFEIVLTA